MPAITDLLIDALQAAITRAADPLTARLRRRAAAALAARLAADARVPAELRRRRALRRPDGRARLAAAALDDLAVRTCRAVAALRVEHAALQRREADLVDALLAARDPTARRAALAAAIARDVRDPRARRADLRALGRWLDGDALRERLAAGQAALEEQVELGVRLLGALPVDVAWPARAPVLTCLISQLTWLPRFDLRLACLGALGGLLDAFAGRGEPLDLDLELRLAAAARGRAGDLAEHPWVQAAALGVLDRLALDAPRLSIPDLRRRAHPGYAPTAEALELAEARLVAPRGGPRDFLARALVVEWLAARARAGRDPQRCVDILLGAVDDPSEHVRIALCAAADAIRSLDPRGAGLLTILTGDRSPRVRAVAARALLRGPADAPALAAFLAEETDPLPLRVACAAAQRLAEETWHAEPAALARLGAALARLATRDDRPPVVHEAAAAALQALDGALDPARRAWTVVLAAALAATPPGGRVRVSLRRPDLPLPGDAAWLGRILAALTRDDWGVDASVRKDSLDLRRGDRWRVRGWRLLHELRHPSPHKRQGFSHARGRVLRGDLRAHSGRLHEVVATEVPGERVHSEREGGWGRHLPLVDDLLGLPLLGRRVVRIASSHGTTELRWRAAPLARLLARLRLGLDYARLAELRRHALDADEPAVRGAYARALRDRYAIDLHFVPHPAAHPSLARVAPAQLLQLFAAGDPPAAAATPALAVCALATPTSPLDDLLTLSGSSQTALALFLAALAALLLVGTYLKTRAIARARAAIPLVIGGWGTRGKSGTERLKAGLFHGLGHRVFAKTTGCEAMFIHAVPRGVATEIYTFRPYGKATIWEQRTLLDLAARTGSDVFLWECMALNPAYVEILQHHWMRDDAATITNCYPDHEDIQGPAGHDVAAVIAGFVPTAAHTVTTEINFLPVLRDAAAARGSPLEAVDEFAGDLLPEDLLRLVPYDEHPRNVALVAALAVRLGVPRDLAIATMAEHVVPDLGVLKRYGPARVAGRVLEFINGCSANERAGFLSNWRRTGCDRLDRAREPDRCVITVVNNRDDRVARSQVFARVLVEDVAADRHVLIGTNTQGLVGYIREALDAFLAAQELLTADDLQDAATGRLRAHQRLDRLLARVRVVAPEALPGQLVVHARGAGRSLAGVRDDVARRLAPHLAADPAAPVLLAEVQPAMQADLGPWCAALVDGADALDDGEPPEATHPAEADEVAAHFVREVARAAIAARLHARLDAALAAGPHARDALHAAVRAAYRALFLDLLDVVDDPLTTGDQVIVRCARAVPPGVRCAVMGTQNIKGTGLDFVYRWIALDAAQRQLAALASHEPEVRKQALQRLAEPADPGLVDAALVAATLARRAADDGEAAVQALACDRAREHHARRLAALQSGPARGGRLDAWLGRVEALVDFLDAARRHVVARRVMRDLVAARISHARAAAVMRELDARAKGGWLARTVRRRRG